MFELAFQLPAIPLIVLWIGAAATTATIGLLNSRDVFSKTPLAVIREMSE